MRTHGWVVAIISNLKIFEYFLMKLLNNTDFPLLAIYLMPVWWILGVDFIIFHVFSIIILLKSPSAVKPKDNFHLFILFILFALVFSLIFNLIAGNVDSYRFFAALNNASVLFVGYVFYGYFTLKFRSDPLYIEELYKACSRVFIFFMIVALVMAYFVLRGSAVSVAFPTLFGLITPKLPGLLGEYQSILLVGQNFFNGETTPRLYVLAPFATGSAILCAITGYLAYAYYRHRSRGVRVILLSLMLVGVMLTLTRSATAALLLGFIFLTALYFKGRGLIILMMLFPIGIVLSAAIVPGLLQDLNSMRQGSSDTRFLVYEKSVQSVVDENQLIGFGVKPRTNDVGIPIGSHSTFLSILVRSGFIGMFLAIAAFILIPLSRVFKLVVECFIGNRLKGERRLLAAANCALYLSCLTFLVFQDIDAYASLCVLIFTAFASLFYISSNRYVNYKVCI